MRRVESESQNFASELLEALPEQSASLPEKIEEAFSLSVKHKMEQQLLKCTLESKEKNLVIDQLKRRLEDQERRFTTELVALKEKLKSKSLYRQLAKERLILDPSDILTTDTRDKNDLNNSGHSEKNGALSSPRFEEIRHYSFKASKFFNDKLEAKTQSSFGKNGQYANELLSVMDNSNMSFSKDSPLEAMQKELKCSENVR